jgi:hypothetical protein
MGTSSMQNILSFSLISKNSSDNPIYRTVILPVVLYGVKLDISD